MPGLFIEETSATTDGSITSGYAFDLGPMLARVYGTSMHLHTPFSIWRNLVHSYLVSTYLTSSSGRYDSSHKATMIPHRSHGFFDMTEDSKAEKAPPVRLIYHTSQPACGSAQLPRQSVICCFSGF